MAVGLGAVLVTGLLAGAVSCAAVQGFMLAGLVARHRGGMAAAHAVVTGPAGSGLTVTSAPPRRWATRLADDLTPVGGFLAGKVVSHAILGALLGALGGVLRFGPVVQGVFWLVIGGLVVAFALAQMRVPGFARLGFGPPASWSRFVRGRARSRSAFAPTVFGFATVLVPCSVTLSIEALALTSGSAVAGAAMMVVFVVGTGPLFVALGYASRRLAASSWRNRLAVAAGLVVLVIGLLSVNDGLVSLGSPVASAQLAQILG